LLRKRRRVEAEELFILSLLFMSRARLLGDMLIED
jgi:hypothetical protein